MKLQQQITRPIVRYHGGKFLLADWIISHFPEHRVYTEAFGGGGSVLLKKRRSYAEIYNDLDNEIVNLFEVVRDSGNELKHLLINTPFSRVEFQNSYIPSSIKIEQARRTVVRAYMGFGSAAASLSKTGFRCNSNRSGTTPAHDWRNYPEALDAIIERLQGVVIENRNAMEVIEVNDTPNTLHYVDPPYMLDTRHNGQATKAYKFEMTDEDHRLLLVGLRKLKGMVVLSGYDNHLYNYLLPDWKKIERKALADGARERIEVLWLSPNIKINQQLTIE